MNSTKTAVIIVAAGEGSRLGGLVPKAYQPIAGKPMLAHSIEIFCGHTDISGVIIVHHPLHQAYITPIQEAYPEAQWVEGGATRQASVHLGLKALENNDFTHVLIHDAARPYIDAGLVSRVVEALNHGAKAVLPVIPVKDTIKQVADDNLLYTPERSRLVAAQTPQGFDFPLIYQLHQQFSDKAATDDTILTEWAGIPVQTVEGNLRNIKITTQEDLPMGQKDEGKTLPEASFRVGQGFDVHALSTEGATGSIMLCGIAVPCHARLVGHSDGDVGIHALVDAILGALGEGDIGQHFPPSDDRWKGAASHQFLAHACQLMQEYNAKLVNADITIICERPKVGPHRETMRQKLAEIMQVDVSRISVKATTTEKLGFTGREEGIAAQAVVMLSLHG